MAPIASNSSHTIEKVEKEKISPLPMNFWYTIPTINYRFFRNTIAITLQMDVYRGIPTTMLSIV